MSEMIYNHIDYKRDPFLATPVIAKILRQGRLNLFLGAGVMKGFGLPSWKELIASVMGKPDDPVYLESLDNKSDKDIAKLIDPLDDESIAYLTRIYDALYGKVSPDLLDQLQRSPLLLAVTALLTGSYRGRIQNVYTYNYDNLIEQYLKMLGHQVNLRTHFDDFSKKADVEINHVHGFLPQSWIRNPQVNELVLSEKSYRKRRAHIDEGWSKYVEASLYSKDALLLGLSADDSLMLDVFKRANDKIKRQRDYCGYWLMTPDAYGRNESSVRDVGICPIPLEIPQFPKFVFQICENALPIE